jgi:hypothetical protein
VFWSVVWLLIRLRVRLATRTMARSAPALIGSAFALLVLVPAAVAAGGLCQQRFASLPAPRDEWFLRSIPLRRGQAVTADALGALFDLPTLLTVPLFVAVARHFGGSSLLATALVLAALALFCLQTVVLSQFLSQAAAYLGRRFRGAATPLLALLLLTACLSSGLPSAFAETAAGSGNTVAVTGHAPLLTLTPAGLVAAAIGTAHREAWGTALLCLAAAAVGVGLLAGADGLRAAAERAGERGADARTFRRPLAPDLFYPALSQIFAVAGVEWRYLARDPGAHLPLRVPAMLLLVCFFGWIAPNLGDDPFLNLRDLLGMGGLLYVLLWPGRAWPRTQHPSPARCWARGRWPSS